MKYTIEHIASIVKGSFLQFHGSAQIEQLLLDSRRLIFPDSSLFFALKGERREGHSYIEELYKRGVRNFIVDRPVTLKELPEANIIQVKDSLVALQGLASFHREQFDIPVIGITGSNGKTIVKEWLNQLLEDEYQIVRSPKSYNSQIGVPLSVWQMNETHELGIFEAGISQRGEMGRLASVILPTLGIFTNIGEAHSEGFENNQEKIMEKLLLFTGSRLLIYCQDQPEMKKAIDSWRDQVRSNPEKKQGDIELFSWGHKASSILQVIAVQRTATDSTVLLKYRDEEFSILIPFTDEAAFENSMSCVCLLLWLGKAGETMMKKLNRLTPVAMRLELKEGINNCSIINDSYSADLSSLKIALDFLSQQQQHQKRTVILSDILQSGKKEEDLYRQVAELLRQKKINRLIAVGPRIGTYQALFEQYIGGEIRCYSSSDGLLLDFPQIQFKNETILIKGARVFEFEKIDRVLSQQVHQTVLEINLSAMAHNLKQYQRLLEPSTKLMAMVKAFAYGSGTFEIANLLQFHKVDWLAVAYADEGIQLRRAGIHLPIMVMNPEDNSFDVLLQYHLEPVIYSFRLLEALDLFAKKQGLLQVPVHIELETGMNRLGFSLKDLSRLIPPLTGSSFKVQSVFTHLSASEEQQQDPFTAAQASLFLEATAQIERVLRYPFLRHIANSAAIVRHPEYQLDMVRLGIGLYGIDPAGTHRLDLQEVSILKSTIAQIRQLRQGETVGYNRKGWIDQEASIATVRLGYADGYPRSLGNGVGKMWLKGKFVPTIGSICMDMTMIDITGVPGVMENDEITIFGNELSVQQLAHWAQTIPYEILTGISQRVKRVYFEE